MAEMTGSPLWADRQETRFGFLPGYHHVVGHTPIEKIETFTGQHPGSITYTDVLHLGRNKGVFHYIEL